MPDFDAASALIREVGDHPAAESYEWLTRLNALIAEKPEKFNRVMLAPEKKLLEESLERALGVARKKAVPRKTAVKKAAGPKALARRGRPPKPPSDLFSKLGTGAFIGCRVAPATPC